MCINMLLKKEKKNHHTNDVALSFFIFVTKLKRTPLTIRLGMTMNGQFPCSPGA